MKPPLVAADTNLLRHPTPRRYLTVIEGLRNRPIVILPSVDAELARHLPLQIGEFIDDMAQRRSINDDAIIEAAKAAGATAALRWWRTERQRNDSVYEHPPNLGEEHYTVIAAQLPARAFTEEKKTDRWIYAEAMAHDVDVLASHNRNTILTQVLEQHFAKQRSQSRAVEIRGLFEHTVAVAEEEERPIEEAGFKAMLCAIIPGAWSGSEEDTERLEWSAQRFIANLGTGKTKPGETPNPEREKLAHLLRRTLAPMTVAQLRTWGNAAYAIAPEMARETERRYHTTTRTAIGDVGLGLWKR